MMQEFNKTWAPLGTINVQPAITPETLGNRYTFLGPKDRVENPRIYAVALSHILAIKLAAKLNYSLAIIMEDDARLDYMNLFPNILNLTKTYLDFAKDESHNLLIYSTFGHERRKDLHEYKKPYFGTWRLWRGLPQDTGAVAYITKPHLMTQALNEQYCADKKCHNYEVKQPFAYSDWIIYSLKGILTRVHVPSIVSHRHPFTDSADLKSRVHNDHELKAHHDWQMKSHYLTIEQFRHFQAFLPNYNECMDARAKMFLIELQDRDATYGCECGSKSCPCEDKSLKGFGPTCFLTDGRLDEAPVVYQGCYANKAASKEASHYGVGSVEFCQNLAIKARKQYFGLGFP